MLCSQCNSSFSCSTQTECWCYELPHILPIEKDRDCLCKDCLLDTMADYCNTNTHNLNDTQRKEISKLGPSNGLKQGKDYYQINQNGQSLLVFTSWYLLKRGYCCENGCKHCPYPSTT